MAGQFRPDYLTELFLVLRSQSFGIAPITEIGHFVAHSDERTHGLVTDEAKDILGFMKLSMPFWWDKQLDYSNLPPGIVYYIRQNSKRLESTVIREKTGFKRKVADRLIKSALAKFCVLPDREFLTQPLTADEATMLDYAYTTVVLRQLFTDTTLHRDFLMVLERNKLITAGERGLLNYLKAPLALYAIERMNETTLILDDGWTANLHISLLNDDHTDRLLGVSASAVFDPKLKGIAGLTYSIFSTSLIADEWCSDTLLKLLAFKMRVNAQIQFELELTTEPKLDLLTAHPPLATRSAP